MIKKHIAFSFAIFTSFFLCIPTMANGSGFYGGIYIGQYNFEEQNIDTSDLGIGVTGGYTLNSYIDLEASVFDIGEHEEIGMEAVGLSLSIVGKYSITDRWQVFGQFGGFSLDLDIDETIVPLDEEGNQGLSDGRDSSLFLGYGVKYNFEKWTVFVRRSHADLDADVVIVSLGALYHF